jgi:cellulose synthase operon protein C
VRLLCMAVIAALALVVNSTAHGLDDAETAYIAALRDQGFPDLAIDYLESRIAAGKLSVEEKADVEFEIAALHGDLSRQIDDLVQRDQALSAASDRFAEFARKHPDHPRQGEALAETAAIAVQKGRLRVVQAQLPSYQAQAGKFADEGRTALRQSAENFKKAADQISQQRDKLPLRLEDEKQNAPLQRRRTRLFNKIAEARFQHAYAIFLAADSYRTVPIAAANSDVEEEYQKGIKAAEEAFTAISDDYRQWLIGPVARAWQARCLAARGEHRKARGIFEEVLANKDRRLGQVHRQAFFFQLLSLAQEKDFATVVARGEQWLRENARYRNTPEAFGVQLELARACVGMADAAVEPKKTDLLRKANGFFEVVGKSANEYQGLARREQLKIEPLLAKDVPLREFQQFFSRATARLDAITPQSTSEERNQALAKVKELLEKAIEVAKPTDPVHQAKLMLAFAHFQAGEYAEAAKIAEAEIRESPKTSSAPQLLTIGLASLGMQFEKAVQSRGDVDGEAKRIEELASFGIDRFPNSNVADESRLSLARLHAHATRKKYAEAAALLKAVPASSSRFAEARSELGRLCVEWSQAVSKGHSNDEAKAKRNEALGYLQEASESLQKTRRGQLDRLVFATEGLLAELLLEKGNPQEAWTRTEPLAMAVERGTLPSSVDPALRLSASLTALQAAIQLGKFDVTDRLIEIVSKQQGQEQAGDVTQVFLMLAARMREQLEKQQAAGDASAGQKLEESYIAFLDRLAGRETGQTLQSLAFLGTAYVEIRRLDKAEPILQRALAEMRAAPPTEKNAVLRVKVADAMCKSGLGKHDEAISAIDTLFEAEGQVQEVVFAKGKILMAAGRLREAEAHWNRLVVGTIRQRPPTFYDALHQLIETLLLQSGNERKAALTKAEKLLRTVLDRPHATMTPARRERLERQLRRIESE